MFRERFGATWRLDVLDGMNEVYVSSPHTVKNTSDEVFYTRHIDGPYYFVPFASCFRSPPRPGQSKKTVAGSRCLCAVRCFCSPAN